MKAPRPALIACATSLFMARAEATAALAQDTTVINAYRFVLGIDVPESPALVVVGVAPTHVLRAAAPKPLSLNVLDVFVSGGDPSPGVAIDIAPYFLAGGGARRLGSYRSMSLAGRLMRVLTKTLLSVGAARDPADAASLVVGFGVRSTFHDPHDPLSTTLPEEAAAVLARAGVPASSSADEEVGDHGVDLTQAFARARRTLRRPSANPQVSGGWGVAARLRGGVLDGDSVETERHCLWLGAQFTAGRLFDVLTTAQLRSAFRAERYWWLGVGLERKTTAANFLAELYYDTQGRRLHPGIAVDARASSHVGVVASLTTQSATLSGPGPRRFELRTLARWFYASDR